MTKQILSAAPYPLLLRMASPNAVAFFVQAGVSMAELGFVSQIGTAALAGLALLFPGLMLMQMLANGAMGGAVSSAIARAIGAGDLPRAENLLWHALTLAVMAGIGFFLAFALLGEGILRSAGVSDAVYHEAFRYGTIVFSGSLLIWTMALLSSVFRGMGNMKFPATLMIAGSIIQVPLSGALILGWFGLPRLGLEGAAIAVIVMSAINTGILLTRLLTGATELKPRLAALHYRWNLFADILRVGGLASLSPVLIVLIISVTNVLIGGFGEAALAGYGIVSRVEFLLVPLVFGFGAAMTAMVGINMGAGQRARAAQIAWMGGASAAFLTGLVGIVLALSPGLLLDFFTEDPTIWQAGATYLTIVGPFFAFQGLGLSLYFASQGAGTVIWPVCAALVRAVIAVGGGVIGVRLLGFGLDYLFACLAAGMLAFGVLTAWSVRFGWGRHG